MNKLTKRTIDAIKPGAGETFLWDDELRGFGLRVKPSGVKTYVVQYRTDTGRTRRLAIGRAQGGAHRTRRGRPHGPLCCRACEAA